MDDLESLALTPCHATHAMAIPPTSRIPSEIMIIIRMVVKLNKNLNCNPSLSV